MFEPHDFEIQPTPEPLRPGTYFVHMYFATLDGDLVDYTTAVSYEAQCEDDARSQAQDQYPTAAIASINFDEGEEEDENDDVSAL